MNARARKSLATALSVVGLSGAVMAMSAPSASADGLGHDAVIKLKSDSPHGSLYVCKDWGSTVCSSNSARGTLHRGENTKSEFSWHDADGLWVEAGTDVYTVGIVNGHHFQATGWHKIRGCGGCTVTVRVVDNGG